MKAPDHAFFMLLRMRRYNNIMKNKTKEKKVTSEDLNLRITSFLSELKQSLENLITMVSTWEKTIKMEEE